MKNEKLINLVVIPTTVITAILMVEHLINPKNSTISKVLNGFNGVNNILSGISMLS